MGSRRKARLFICFLLHALQPVPATAVFVQNDQPMVVRVEDGKTFRTPVKLGVRQGNKVEIIKKQVQVARSNEGIEWKDFSGDEVLIRANPENWTDGQSVRPNHLLDAQAALASPPGS